MAAIPGPRNPPVMAWNIRAAETGTNCGQRAMMSALTPTITVPAATRSLFDRATSRSVPPGNWANTQQRRRRSVLVRYLLGPVLRPEDQGNEWPEASQRSSHKEIDSVESTQALIGWRVAHIERLCWGDRQVDVSVEPPVPVWRMCDGITIAVSGTERARHNSLVEIGSRCPRHSHAGCHSPACTPTSAVGPFETCRRLPMMSAHRGRPEVIDTSSERRA